MVRPDGAPSSRIQPDLQLSNAARGNARAPIARCLDLCVGLPRD